MEKGPTGCRPDNLQGFRLIERLARRLSVETHLSAISATQANGLLRPGSGIASVSVLGRVRSFNRLGFMGRTARYLRGLLLVSAPCPCGLGQAKLKPNSARDDLKTSKMALRRHFLELFTSVRTLHEEEPEYP